MLFPSTCSFCAASSAQKGCNPFRISTGLFSNGKIIWFLALFVCSWIVVNPSSLPAAQVKLEWKPNDNKIEGYRVYQRTAGDIFDYDKPIWPDNGTPKNETSCTIDNLEDGVTYYFVVRGCKDNFESQDSNEVEFHALSNHKPVARAGVNQKVKSGGRVHLDGTRSYDVDGDSLTYQYNQIGGPEVELDCKEGRCSFIAPAVEDNTVALVFALTVDDGIGLNNSSTTIILVSPTQIQEGEPIEKPTEESKVSVQTGNQAPDQPVVTVPRDEENLTVLTPRISASDFEDPDHHDSHMLTQWQIIDRATGQHVLDRICLDTHHTELIIPELVLNPSSRYELSVRYFDRQGFASNWSEPVSFTTGKNPRDVNQNQIPDELEVSEDSDLNGDGTIDSDPSSSLKRLYTYNDRLFVGISLEGTSDAEVVVQAVTSIDPMTLETTPNPGQRCPLGLLGNKIKVSRPGDSVDVVIYFSDALIDPKQVHWMRYDNINGWLDSSGTTAIDVNGYVVERNLIDGGEEDADGVANGVIIDLSGPMYIKSPRMANTNNSNNASPTSNTGNGGCFLQTF